MTLTCRASVLTGYAELARAVGLDPLRMLDAVGLPREALTNPDLRISTSAGRDLLENAGRAAEDFGLRLYDYRTPSVWGAVTLVAREQPTVRDALETVIRYTALHSDSSRLVVEDLDQDSTLVRLLSTWSTPGPSRQATEMSLGQFMRFLRLYLGSSWRPQSVLLAHAAPRSMKTHHRIFGPNILFDQEFSGFVCARADLDRPNPFGDPEMARHAERYIEGLGGGAPARLEERVRQMIQLRLPAGACTAEMVAWELSMDLRTFQRRLAASGVSFLEIVQAVRLDLAAQYLEQGDKPLAEVAELLGFSALSAFSRWHKAQLGLSPRARRDAVRGLVD